MRRRLEDEANATANAPTPSVSVVPPTKPASRESSAPHAPKPASVAVIEPAAAPAPAQRSAKEPTANEILEVASAKRVAVVAPKKEKPKTAKEAMRLRVEAEQSKRRAAPEKKAKKPEKSAKSGPASEPPEADEDPPSLTKRSEDVARVTEPPKLGFWARVKKLIGR